MWQKYLSWRSKVLLFQGPQAHYPESHVPSKASANFHNRLIPGLLLPPAHLLASSALCPGKKLRLPLKEGRGSLEEAQIRTADRLPRDQGVRSDSAPRPPTSQGPLTAAIILASPPLSKGSPPSPSYSSLINSSLRKENNQLFLLFRSSPPCRLIKGYQGLSQCRLIKVFHQDCEEGF